MSPASKQGAYSKIDNVVKNIAFPDWVTDDEKLDNYYKKLDIDMHNDDYLTMLKKIRRFTAVREIESLLAGPVPRDDFYGSAATVNAWYQVCAPTQYHIHGFILKCLSRVWHHNFSH
ncbi:hypothetical protein ANCDUO_11252 [Ancylostoma duodenale]|uniref:Uncharacterized protein n=1 Tax=Ancylostoma duodenale TaxID=51022 RepID=A0A0C2D8Q5_9BILA|nr:hypothetical protein ANCDUO_11252 [Ancylostoma duodenale]